MLPNPIIKIGSLSIYMYGVMIAVGILACFAVLYGYSKILKISPKLTDFVFYNAIAAIAVGFGAAALWQALYNYIQNPAAGFHIGQGITFIGGLLGGVVMYYASGKKINPLIGSAGVSAVPMAARVSQDVGRKYNKTNFLLMHAMGPNVAGVIGSAIAAGFLLSVFGG